MSWTWLMIVFLFNSCSANPITEINTDDEMQINQDLCYLRVQPQHCSDQTHLDVEIDGVVRQSTSVDEFVCLKVYCDKSKTSIVGIVTIVADTGRTEPTEGFSGEVEGIYSSESECLQGDSNSVHITCQLQQTLDELMVMSQDDLYMEKNSMKTDVKTQGETGSIQMNNYFKLHLVVTCGSYQGLYWVKGMYDFKYEDRVWMWYCHTITKTPWNYCYWTPYVSSSGHYINAQCSINYVLAGVDTFHDNGDRQWSFRCCQATNHITAGCFETDFLNKWNAMLNYEVTYPLVFTGVTNTLYNSQFKDRKWKIRVCQYL